MANAWITLSVILFFSDVGQCARRVDIQAHLTSWRARRSAEFNKRSDERPEEVLGLKDPDEQLTAVDSLLTKDGQIEIKYQEEYKGIPVEGETVVVKKTWQGDYTSVYGQLANDLKDDLDDVVPQLSKMDAFRIAVSFKDHDDICVNFDPNKDIQLKIKMYGEGENLHPKLVYKLSYTVECGHKMKRPFFIIDAVHGDILETWPGMDTATRRVLQGYGGNKKVGKHEYGQSDVYPKLKVPEVRPGVCALENEYVKVVSANNHGTASISKNTKAFEFDCDKGISDAINDGYSPLTDAYHFATQTVKMYEEWYNLQPLEHKVIAVVHYGKNLDNAFFDGTTVKFGDGQPHGRFYPLVSLGVLAHEVSHGVTGRFSDLQYWRQSGALNEGFSDIAAVAAEQFLYNKTDWKLGFSIFKDPNGAFRYFDNPTTDGKSIKHAKYFCPTMDVHFSSGIPNYAFYLLANKPGWDIRSAFELFLIANRMYWNENTDYNQAACGVVEAAKTWMDKPTEDIFNIFRQVGVEPCAETNYGSHLLKGSSGSVIKLSYDAEAKHRLMVYSSYNIGKINVTVKSEYESAEYDVDVYAGDLVDIPTEGKHEITVVGDTYFDNWDIIAYNTKDVVTIVDNDDAVVGENYTKITWNVSEGYAEQYGETRDWYVVATTKNGTLASPIWFTYKTLPDPDSFQYDYKVNKPTPNYEHYGQVICNLMPGTYHLWLKSDKGATGLNVAYVPLIDIERPDKQI